MIPASGKAAGRVKVDIEVASWPWQRCKARLEKCDSGGWYFGRCDRKKGHEGPHVLERGFDWVEFEVLRDDQRFRAPLKINGVPACDFIKQAYGLDPYGTPRFEMEDPIQRELRMVEGWIKMAQHDALQERSATNQTPEAEPTLEKGSGVVR